MHLKRHSEPSLCGAAIPPNSNEIPQSRQALTTASEKAVGGLWTDMQNGESGLLHVAHDRLQILLATGCRLCAIGCKLLRDIGGCPMSAFAAETRRILL